jgi:glutamate dehydrogenase (NADP+)
VYKRQVQNRNGWYWTLSEVNQRLQGKMQIEAEQVWQISQDSQIDLRTAAYVQALKRLGEALDAKGNRNYFVS